LTSLKELRKQKADVYILTKLEYYNDWIIREIDETLLPERPLSYKSIKATPLV
jgi:secreted trypsin-like serine protease